MVRRAAGCVQVSCALQRLGGHSVCERWLALYRHSGMDFVQWCRGSAMGAFRCAIIKGMFRPGVDLPVKYIDVQGVGQECEAVMWNPTTVQR